MPIYGMGPRKREPGSRLNTGVCCRALLANRHAKRSIQHDVNTACRADAWRQIWNQHMFSTGTKHSKHAYHLSRVNNERGFWVYSRQQKQCKLNSKEYGTRVLPVFVRGGGTRSKEHTLIIIKQSRYCALRINTTYAWHAARRN